MAKDHLDAEAIRAAQGVLDAFMKAFNARDIPAWEDTFNFPTVRLASQGLVIINKGDLKSEAVLDGALAEWDHSAWDRREVIHAGPDKVHIDNPLHPLPQGRLGDRRLRFDLRRHPPGRPLGHQDPLQLCALSSSPPRAKPDEGECAKRRRGFS